MESIKHIQIWLSGLENASAQALALMLITMIYGAVVLRIQKEQTNISVENTYMLVLEILKDKNYLELSTEAELHNVVITMLLNAKDFGEGRWN